MAPRFIPFAAAVVLFVATAVAAALTGAIAWIVIAVLLAAVVATGIHDLTQHRHSILRNYPLLGHFRFGLEALRPELQQYFIERDTDGTPYDRDTRTSIYQRAKGIKDEQAFGTELDVTRPGYEWLVHSISPVKPPEDPPRVHIGGPDCKQPVRDVAAERLRDELRRALQAGADRPQPGREAGRLRPRHRRGRPHEVPPRGRRGRDLGARQRLLRRARQAGQLRRAGVQGQGRAPATSSSSASSSARARSPASAASCRARR